MPNDWVWIMKDNKPVQKMITSTRAFVSINGTEIFIRVEHSFDAEHKQFILESEMASTKEGLKKLIFG